MILIESKNVAFFHIPKCGGTTIQKWLRQHFDQPSQFYGKREHPGLGTVYPEHFTLDQLADQYPDVFERVAAMDSYVLLRDPVARFCSALGQYANEFMAKNITLMSPEETDALGLSVLSKLQNLDGAYDFQLVHFTPQVAYVEHQGQRVVQNLCDMSKMDAVFEDLSDRLDIPLPTAPKQNARKQFRLRFLAQPLRWLDRAAKALLPRKQARALNTFGIWLFQKPISGQRSSLLGDETLQKVRDFYHQDVLLFQEVSGFKDPALQDQ